MKLTLDRFPFPYAKQHSPGYFACLRITHIAGILGCMNRGKYSLVLAATHSYLVIPEVMLFQGRSQRKLRYLIHKASWTLLLHYMINKVHPQVVQITFLFITIKVVRQRHQILK